MADDMNILDGEIGLFCLFTMLSKRDLGAHKLLPESSQPGLHTWRHHPEAAGVLATSHNWQLLMDLGKQLIPPITSSVQLWGLLSSWSLKQSHLLSFLLSPVHSQHYNTTDEYSEFYGWENTKLVIGCCLCWLLCFHKIRTQIVHENIRT